MTHHIYKHISIQLNTTSISNRSISKTTCFRYIHLSPIIVMISITEIQKYIAPHTHRNLLLPLAISCSYRNCSPCIDFYFVVPAWFAFALLFVYFVGTLVGLIKVKLLREFVSMSVNCTRFCQRRDTVYSTREHNFFIKYLYTHLTLKCTIRMERKGTNQNSNWNIKSFFAYLKFNYRSITVRTRNKLLYNLVIVHIHVLYTHNIHLRSIFLNYSAKFLFHSSLA